VNAWLAVVLAAAAADDADVGALQRVWSGVRDSSEQVIASEDPGAQLWPQDSERRVRTVTAAVPLPWLGAHVLYLEEFLEDDPQQLRRQLLIVLEAAPQPAHAVRAHLYTFREPRRWAHLEHRPGLESRLSARDVVGDSGCDLLLERSGEQFRGGTVGRRCIDTSFTSSRYLDYQLVIGADVYWYRRRLLRSVDGELQEELIGFNRFEPNEAQLFTCRIAWSASGDAHDLHALLTLDLYESGGSGRFVTPDGRTLQLTLHGRDWPYTQEENALLLQLQEGAGGGPLATAWAQSDAQQIELALGWLEVRCGALAPQSQELAQ
jgi:CpeT/CpcT family (DUF1001)